MAQGVAPSYAEECKYFSALPDDCAGAQYRKYDNLRDYRYEEIELFAKDPLKKVLYVSTYNTTGLNGGDEFARTRRRPRSLQRLDPKRIAKQYQALSAQIKSTLLSGRRTGSPTASAQSGVSMV